MDPPPSKFDLAHVEFLGVASRKWLTPVGKMKTSGLKIPIVQRTCLSLFVTMCGALPRENLWYVFLFFQSGLRTFAKSEFSASDVRAGLMDMLLSLEPFFHHAGVRPVRYLYKDFQKKLESWNKFFFSHFVSRLHTGLGFLIFKAYSF